MNYSERGGGDFGRDCSGLFGIVLDYELPFPATKTPQIRVLILSVLVCRSKQERPLLRSGTGVLLSERGKLSRQRCEREFEAVLSRERGSGGFKQTEKPA